MTFDIGDKTINENLVKNIKKIFSSSNINFLIGSGCSRPALQPLGDVEANIQALFEAGNDTEAREELAKFAYPIIENSSILTSKTAFLSADDFITIDNYSTFLRSISDILQHRSSGILTKRANIFTTNYDLYIEKASEYLSPSTCFNDGFSRNSSVFMRYKYSPNTFFHSVYNNGNLYNYQVQLPYINLIKIHGSSNWIVENGEIYQSTEYFDSAKNAYKTSQYDDFLKYIPFVLPTKDKFSETTLKQIYYDLLRIYSNELDKENTILIAIGFSFADEHILELTKRALRNPTLKLIVFCYDEDGKDKLEEIFKQFQNVNLVYSSTTSLDFSFVNKLLYSLTEVFDNE
ncbi:MAG: SIR2 family protein [Treponema sp.]|nr:SIR2 family protein [Treponema sp.]